MSFAGFSLETAMRRTFDEISMVGERGSERGKGRKYILSGGVCGFYLREDVAEVFGQLLCAGWVDLHFFLC